MPSKKAFTHDKPFRQKCPRDAFDARVESDYEVSEPVVTADLEARLADMKLFISTIKAWLETHQEE